LVIWITGLSGAGKTTISKEVYQKLKKEHTSTVLLDGDILRGVLSDFDYTLNGRLKGAKQIHNLCAMLERQGILVICATMSLFEEIYQLNRKEFQEYLEIFIDVEMELLIQRDSKQLYSKALQGKEKNVVGIDLTFDIPKDADIILENDVTAKIAENVDKIMQALKTKGAHLC
jgi:adenylylsulfate kinase-like enzyme